MTKIYWLSLLAFLLIGASVQGQSNLISDGPSSNRLMNFPVQKPERL